MLTMQASTAGSVANMGDPLNAPQGAVVDFEVHEAGADRGNLVLLEDGHEMTGLTRSATSGAGETYHLTWTADGNRHWFRPQVSGPGGKLWLLGNPVYVNWN